MFNWSSGKREDRQCCRSNVWRDASWEFVKTEERHQPTNSGGPVIDKPPPPTPWCHGGTTEHWRKKLNTLEEKKIHDRLITDFSMTMEDWSRWNGIFNMIKENNCQ